MPREWCAESKSLKLYLWRLRDRAAFVEALAAESPGNRERDQSPQSWFGGVNSVGVTSTVCTAGLRPPALPPDRELLPRPRV
ncbi:MAG: hypothetical protein QNM02_20895 [Acidimicrobiia bacterium]|nr:hypothetical protein [Acidimicrobiia bacterium]